MSDATTTLRIVESHNPCERGWDTLLAGLGKTRADDEPLSLIRILDINGFDDALWALRCLGDDPRVHILHADYAERVVHIYEREYPGDNRIRHAIDTRRRYARGEVTREELAAARAAADAAARDDAETDAYAAKLAATWDAALDAAREARAAARAAARDAERKWQEQRFREIFGGEYV